jgi:1,2-phenylacetyl-CoA epoxidase catalytic subunit
MKINGRTGKAELHKALGNKTILGCTGVVDYALKIAKIDLDELYRHGMEQYGIRPSNRKNARQTFEKRCVAEFKKATGQLTQNVSPQMPKNKKKREALQKILDKGK